MSRNVYLVATAVCALIGGVGVAAFQSQGGAATAFSAGGIDVTQIVNLVAMLFGGGGTVFGLLKAWAPAASEVATQLRQRTASGKEITPDFIAAAVGLQALRVYFADVPAAKAPIDTLVNLAWQVDSGTPPDTDPPNTPELLQELQQLRDLVRKLLPQEPRA